ncbi:MAG TPA: hypothetical protein DHM90_08330 [Clostridiaceae bacterium]|nr:hypothetical protein [Clostridiaceae bacterium]
MKNNRIFNQFNRIIIYLSSRRVIVFSSILLTAALLFSGIGMLIHNSIQSLIINELTQSSLNTAVTAAAFIEADIESYEKLSDTSDYAEGQYDEAYYDHMQNIFRKIRKETGVDFIYTVKKISENEMAYVLDGEDPDSELFSPLGSRDVLTAFEQKVFYEGKAITTGMQSWEGWGDYLSGFSPIINNEGKVIGIVGADKSSDSLSYLMSSVDLIILMVALFMVLLTTIYTYKIVHERAVAYNVDYLTKLSSRRYHDLQLRHRIDHLSRKGGELSMMMLDVDNFKYINDVYGHEMGDYMLRHVAEIIRGNLRKSDISSRIGGDEFNIILPDTTLEEARKIADRIIKEVQGTSGELNVSVSIGLATWVKDMNAVDITRLADMAMYKAKASGRNQVQVVQANA